MTKIFKFENQQVRFVGTADDPWWVAADVCAILEVKNVPDALSRLDEDEKGTIVLTDTIGREQNYRTINESGLYSLILSSRKEVSKPFKKWVTSEVLPAIRKTGSYSLTTNTDTRFAEDLMLADYAARSAQNAGVDKDITEQIKLDSLMKAYPDRKLLLKPQKDAISASHPLPNMLITPTEIGHKLAVKLGYPKISAKKVNSKLLELGYQVSITRIKRSNGKEVHDYYQATEKGKPHSKLLISAYVDGEGKNTKAQLKWFNSIVDVLANNWEAE